MDNQTSNLSNQQLRHWAYMVLIVLTAGHVAGRILSTTPLGDNDRSRWVTVRSLVENGTYEIGRRAEFPPLGELGHRDALLLRMGRILAMVRPGIEVGIAGPLPPPPPMYVDEGLIEDRDWSTIDKVLHPKRKIFYSSKPPLLPTLLAGEYWVLNKFFGLSITEHNLTVIRIILFTVNWLPLVIFLVLMADLIDRLALHDWTRLFAFGATCLGTLLVPFLITLNNHTIAAYSGLFALYVFLEIWSKERPAWWLFPLAGLLSGWTLCNELPAASLAALLGVLLLYRFPAQTLLLYAPGLLLPVGVMMYMNYLITGGIIPAYAKTDTVWYKYPGSFWAAPKEIDAASESKDVYLLHMLIGHHGIFSLTPIFLLSLMGIAVTSKQEGSQERPIGLLAIMTLLLSVVVVGFYTYRTNNYGGWTAGLRWLFWLIPLWLLAMMPALDRWGSSKIFRGFCYLLLAVSALSVGHPARTPWQHPWLFRLLKTLGVIEY